MSRFRLFITPFRDDGSYGTEMEVTEDVTFDGFSRLSQKIDNNEFDIGVFKYNTFGLKLRNEHGRYSEVGSPATIFKRRRSNSIVRITWEVEPEETLCGLAICGRNRISPTVTLFEGFLNDDATAIDMQSELITFKVLGFESMFSQVEYPLGVVSIGDEIEDVIFKILDQTEITDFFTLDAANINVSANQLIDDQSALERKTVKQGLDQLLLLSNSIIYIRDRTIYVSDRAPSTDVKKTFRGPTATGGIENIQNLTAIKTGLQKTFNYLTWTDTTLKAVDQTSIDRHGVKRKALDSSIFTTPAKQTAIMTDILNEFGSPKRTFRLKTPIAYDILELFYLDKVTIDYPSILIASDDNELPYYDSSIYDVAVYPVPLSSLELFPSEEWKIMGLDIDVKGDTVELELREV